LKNNFYPHLISPRIVLRGSQAWEKGKQFISQSCTKPILIGRSKSTSNIRQFINKELKQICLDSIFSEINYDCCELDLTHLKQLATEQKCDAIIAAGGGKVLDTGKLLAKRLSLPCITVPTSASTCAGWTALSNIYSPQGSFIKDEPLDSCPDILIFDHNFVRQAPPRTLASGMADALAKWYESSINNNESTDGLVQQSVQMARVLRDQLFLDGEEAYQNYNSEAWVRVAEGCALTAGIIGGLGGEKCRTAAAHALHNGLTQLKTSHKALHGEIVGFGLLVQLHLEEIIQSSQLANQSNKQLVEFMKKINMPVSLDELGLGAFSSNKLKEACSFSCKDDSDIHHLPFKVNSNQLLQALITISNNKMETKALEGYR